MSLFVVNRYIGETEDGVPVTNHEEMLNGITQDQQLEKSRLKKLIRKAKKRKKEAEAADTVLEEAAEAESENNKIKTEIDKKINGVLKGEGDDEQKSKSKKRKKEKPTEGSKEVKEVSEDKPSKKKKKRTKKKKVKVADNAIGVNIGGFTVIGNVNQFNLQHVKRVLPDWLANPSIVSCDLSNYSAPITSFNLDVRLAKILEQNMVPYFFPVQKQVIPWLLGVHSPKLLRPSDICVSAPTGSGKTLSYVLPVVQILSKTIYPSVRAIVVLPTEVLATQIFSVFKTYTQNTNLKVFLMTKRTSLSAERQALTKGGLDGKWRTPFDIVVATPGRLVDHLEQTDAFNISQLKFLIVDEADRTLDDQEGDWLQRLEMKFWSYFPTGMTQPWKTIPLTLKWAGMHMKAFQKLLFSATLSQNPETLEKLHLFQPKLFTSIVDSKVKPNLKEVPSDSVDNPESIQPVAQTDVSDSFIGKFTTPSELQESFVLCQKETKPLILTHLISHFKWKRVLCFANTKESTHRLCLLLKHMGHLKVREISSKWNPQTRDMVLKKFNEGSIDILVTSDQMARGIDIPLVDYVISYDLPGYTKTYIHRIGRTARAGREGNAVCLVVKEQIGIFRKTMKNAGKTDIKRIPVKNADLRSLESSFKEALAKLKTELEEETAEKGNKKHDKPSNKNQDKPSNKKQDNPSNKKQKKQTN